MQKILLAAAVACFGLAGCANRQAPGQGYGADYTPVIDLQGVDSARYGADLEACRQMARSVDANRASLEGGIAGAFVGALVSGALRGGRQTTIDAANIGAMGGLGRAGDEALASQKRIVVNCMVGRGYRALEVTPALGSYQAPQALTATGQAGPASGYLQGGAPAAQPAAAAAPVRQNGQFAYEAERIPEARACAAMPQASLVSKGPGFELYAVACRNSDTMMVRCEIGNCRPMR